MRLAPGLIRNHSEGVDLLGESPVWNPVTQDLWWVDIAGQALRRIDAAGQEHRWRLPEEPGCIAPAPDGRILVAQRSALVLFDPASGTSEQLAPVPYDTATTRCNDGRCDARGRFWVGTVFEPKTAPEAGLYRLGRDAGGAYALEQVLGGNLTANGLAFTPDSATAYWSNTPEHVIHRYAFDLASGRFGPEEEFRRFPRKTPGQPYGGRPDGVAIDNAGNYWVAMYEGGRVLQIAPDGQDLLEILLPVSYPTMVCLGGPGLRTLFIATASQGLTAEALAEQTLAGHVLAISLDDLPVAATLRGEPAAVFDPEA